MSGAVDPKAFNQKTLEKPWADITPSPKRAITSATVPPATAVPVLTYAEMMRRRRAANEAARADALVKDPIDIAREANNADDLRRIKASYNRYIARQSRANVTARGRNNRPSVYRRRSPSPRRGSPPRNTRGRFYRGRSPSRSRSPSRGRRAPSPRRRSPSPRRRGPSPARRGPSPARRGPSPARRGPSPARRAPSPRGRNERGRFYTRRSNSRNRNNRGRFTRNGRR